MKILLKRFIRWLRNLVGIKAPELPPAVFQSLHEIAPAPMPRKVVEADEFAARRQRSAKIRAERLVGIGFPRPVLVAPPGFFWKQDRGASDQGLFRFWRLYKDTQV